MKSINFEKIIEICEQFIDHLSNKIKYLDEDMKKLEKIREDIQKILGK